MTLPHTINLQTLQLFLKEVKYQNARNLASACINLSPKLNVFYGPNGAGKSSILEVIGLITSGRSFRTSKLELFVTHSSNECFIHAELNHGQRMGISFNRQSKVKQLKIDGRFVRNLSALSRILPTQMLSPESYQLIDSGPGERRKFLDWCMFHVEHQYFSSWKQFSEALQQRNALLRSYKHRRIDISANNIKEEINVWDKQMDMAVVVINQLRQSLVERFEVILIDVIKQCGLNFIDHISVSYNSGHNEDYLTQLRTSLSKDVAFGFTQFGPHKADLKIKVNGFSCKDYLSRGQKKLLINAMFLAQTSLLNTEVGNNSLFIIDDFSSELDESSQALLLDLLLQREGVQIILSCLGKDTLKQIETRYNMAHMFHVEHGVITRLPD